jgi:hypothetical protein
MRGAEPAKAADFSWATVVDALLPPTPTPPANPPASPPMPQIIPDQIQAAISAAVVEPSVRLDAADTALKVIKRRWKDADVYLFFNESNQESDHVAMLSSKGRSVEAWDAQTGTVSPLDSTSIDGHLNVRLNLQPYETQLLVVR